VAGIYEGAEHYHYVTGERFAPDDLPQRLCPRHKWNVWDRYAPNETGCSKCGAVRRYDWRPDPQPRDDTASQRREGTEPVVRIGTAQDFLTGRTAPPRQQHREPVEVDTYGERHETYSGPYKSGRDYAAEFDPADLLDRIDELIKEG
jgi:hypothetical protein